MSAVIEKFAKVATGFIGVIRWLKDQGLSRERLFELLARADDENRDLTAAEIAGEIDAARQAIDALKSKIETHSAPPPNPGDSAD